MVLILFLLSCTQTKLSVCTKDAKICPDGSHVGRIPPNCEFATCPNVGSTNLILETNNITTKSINYSNCEAKPLKNVSIEERNKLIKIAEQYMIKDGKNISDWEVKTGSYVDNGVSEIYWIYYEENHNCYSISFKKKLLEENLGCTVEIKENGDLYSPIKCGPYFGTL